MMDLTLREEFRGRRIRGTAIELANDDNTGATQVAAAKFLAITYPTGDLVGALKALSPDRGKPVVIIGDRGQGKSHLLATLFHALSDGAATQAWLGDWAGRLGSAALKNVPLRSGMHVIAASLQHQEYRHLWDLVFDRHPDGAYAKGKWEGTGAQRTDVPSMSILREMFARRPTALILDEYQTWFDGLTNTKQYPWKTWAFNFVQLLSELAAERPDHLVLVVSVRNGETDAYQQIQRVAPILVDFKGPNVRGDRLRLLLHRLFENRQNIPDAAIDQRIACHVAEHLTLSGVPPAEAPRVTAEFRDAWPFSPVLMSLLEDQVLVALHAQETRDLIRILSDLFKNREQDAALLTAAAFRVESNRTEIGSLLDSVASEAHRTLRERALRNLEAVRENVKDSAQRLPHLSAVIGALWLRSLRVQRPGAEPWELRVDVTNGRPIDPNQFEAELASIVENGFNIHRDGPRLVFREQENPEARLLVSARNDRLFQADRRDLTRLAREARYVLTPIDGAAASRVIVLPVSWLSDPWGPLDESERPNSWDERVPLLVLPEVPEPLNARLGAFLKERLTRRRGAVRFLVPREGSLALYHDPALVLLARAVTLADEWKQDDAEFRRLHGKYERELRDALRKRWDRVAVLERWHFASPSLCTFHLERVQAEGHAIPAAVEKLVREGLFVNEDFADLVRRAAEQRLTVGQLLTEVIEPRADGEPSLPWIGETAIAERVLRLCAQGDIALDLRGQSVLQAKLDETETQAWERMKGRMPSGRFLDEVRIGPPVAVTEISKAWPAGELTGVPAPPKPPPWDAPPAPTGGSERSHPHDVLVPPEVPPPPKPRVARTMTARPLSLLGELDRWNVQRPTRVRDLTLRVGSLTGGQLRELLKAVPGELECELTLQSDEG